MLEILDDSGFMALIVPGAYASFVAEAWDFDVLRSHFVRQMAQHSMLIWGTGLEGTWRVDLRIDGPEIRGFREVSGPLRVEGGSVLVTSYDSLTMAAQSRETTLPQPHERDQLVAIEDGNYTCKVVQMFDPNENESAPAASTDFVILLSRSAHPLPEWTEIPWQ